MKAGVKYLDLGTIEYKKCWERQQELFSGLVEAKAAGNDPGSAGYIIFCEHPHVYTLGKSGQAENLLVDDDFLTSIGASFYHIDRGGDITYHGPGQLVGYPILDLEKTGFGLREYIGALEQSVIETLAEFGIKASRSRGKTGVWIADRRGERKICAIGVKSSRFITMHGFALNVATDLGYFSYINPCGLAAGGVTSINAETGDEADMATVKRLMRHAIEKNMNIKIKK